MKVSVVIPVYNSALQIPQLLRAIVEKDSGAPEVIVVDDGSTDGSSEAANSLGARVIRLSKNFGPATARNAGVNSASGEIIIFLDADVEPPPGLIAHAVRRMEDEPGLLALNGYYSPIPLNPGFFQSFKARYIHFLFLGKDETQVLETCCAAVRKSVFLELGGFDEAYRGADVEDYELGYRISERGPMKIDHAMVVRHHFPSFFKNARNYFRRGAMWTELYLRRRRFDAAGTTASEGVRHVLGALAAVIMLALPLWPPLLAPVFIVLFGGWLGVNGRFWRYLWREEGPRFTLAGIFVHWVNSVVIVSGVAYGTIRSALKRSRDTR